jgi:uncharacterized membrane protein YkvA (DUF1232 family)
VIEKVWSWTDHDGNVERVLTRDELLDNLMLYWLPRAGASSARLYWESIRQVNGWISGSVMDDLLVLFRGLLRDPRVLRSAKLWLGVAVVWIASPIDLVPEFIPIAGPLDDAIVAALRPLASGASPSTSPPECWLLPPREQS